MNISANYNILVPRPRVPNRVRSILLFSKHGIVLQSLEEILFSINRETVSTARVVL
jgi:hypothetical protein